MRISAPGISRRTIHVTRCAISSPQAGSCIVSGKFMASVGARGAVVAPGLSDHAVDICAIEPPCSRLELSPELPCIALNNAAMAPRLSPLVGANGDDSARAPNND